MPEHALSAEEHILCMAERMMHMQRNESVMQTTIDKLEKKLTDMHSLFELERKVRRIERDKEEIERKIRHIQQAKSKIEATSTRLEEIGDRSYANPSAP